jgi:DNA-binding GntR family transcriptional regulator
MQYQTKKDFALGLIRDLIITGELENGSKLDQGELARRLQISLTPIREALRQLEAEGLVEGSAHKGVRVSSIDLESLENVYVLRRLIEPFAAAKGTPNVRADDISAAEMSLRKLERANSKSDVGGVRAANYDFHFTLYARALLPLTEYFLKLLWARFPWDVLSVVPGRIEESRREHQEIVAAMKERDAKGAALAVAKHLDHSYKAIASHLGYESRPEPFEAWLTSSDDRDLAPRVSTGQIADLGRSRSETSRPRLRSTR